MIDKEDLIKSFSKWESNSIIVDDGKTYRKVKDVYYGMGKGIILVLEETD